MLRLISATTIILFATITSVVAKVNIQTERLGYFNNTPNWICRNISTSVILHQHWERFTTNTPASSYGKGTISRHTVNLVPSAYLQINCYEEGYQTWSSITAVNNGNTKYDFLILKAYKTAKEGWLKEAMKRKDFYQCPYLTCQ